MSHKTMTSNSKRPRSGSFLESHSPLKRSCADLNEDDTGEIGKLFIFTCAGNIPRWELFISQ